MTECIKKGKKLYFNIEKDGIHYNLRDTYDHLTMTLKESCEAFKLPKEICKTDFDIVDVD